MTTSALQLRANHARSRHDQWIIAIGVFKLVQAVLFILMGFGAIRLLHKDLMDVAERLILAMRFNPEGHLVNLILVNVAQIDPHRLKQISAAIFGIAALDIVEGTGLVMEKTWAEFVTLILTASFLPWEIFEIVHRVTWIKIGLTAINLAVLAYLLFFVRMRMRGRRLRCVRRG
jgi:uncharacterized membrane protein (DUF2068 family)